MIISNRNLLTRLHQLAEDLSNKCRVAYNDPLISNEERTNITRHYTLQVHTAREAIVVIEHLEKEIKEPSPPPQLMGQQEPHSDPNVFHKA